MSEGEIETVIELIQLILIGLVSLFIIGNVVSALPGDGTGGPFAETIWLLAQLPWIYLALGVIALLTMVAREVL